MSKLWGDQKNYDRNGDGRLNAGEWQNWYFGKHGHDIEMAERRRVNAVKSICLSLTDRFTYDYERILDCGKALIPDWDNTLEQAMSKAVLHQATLGTIRAGNLMKTVETPSGVYVGGKRFYPFRTLYEAMTSALRLCTCSDAEFAIAAGKPLYLEEGRLTETECGMAWQILIRRLPYYGYWALYDYWEFDAEELVDCVADIYALFAELSEREAEAYRQRCENAFEIHWKAWADAHKPDALRIEREREFRDMVDIYKDDRMAMSLLQQFPQIREDFLRGELTELDGDGVTWFYFSEKRDYNTFLAMYDFLEKQGFDDEQMEGIRLTFRNFRRMQAEGAEQNDPTEYRYCQVELAGVSRPLSYLAGDLELAVGDTVVVPFGRENEERIGRVCSVETHTAATAPFPPKKTKYVLRREREEYER